DGSPMQGFRPVWPYISRISSAMSFRFENVITGGASSTWGGSTSVRQMAFPTLVTVDASGRQEAGMRVWTGTGLHDYLGADADGDGVADSLLFPMTLSEQDGVRYYAAIRIIDNNSALNALTAHGPASTDRDHFFPSSIDLSSMPGVDLNGYAAALGASA